MKQEQRRYTWMDQDEKDKMSKYDYIQKRLGEKKFLNIFKLDSQTNLEDARSMTLKERIEEEKLESIKEKARRIEQNLEMK